MSDNYSKNFNELAQLADIAEVWKNNITSELSKPALTLITLALLGDKLITKKLEPEEDYTALQHSAYERLKKGNDPDKPDREKCDIYRDFLNHADHKIGIMMRLLGSRKLAHALPDTLDDKDKKAQFAEKHNYKNFQKLLTAAL